MEQNPDTEPGAAIRAIAKRFNVHRSTVYYATREMRKALGMSVPRRNGLDLTSMSVDEAGRVLQMLSLQWPNLRAAFLALDAVFRKGKP